MKRALSVLVIAACNGGILSGCGSSSQELTDVVGRITVDGQPVSGCQVTFLPVGGGSPSYGKTDRKGVYQLMFTRDKFGARIGPHKVTLETRNLSAAEQEELGAAGVELSSSSVSIPPRYLEEGALTAEVKSGRNRIDFELTSK